MPEMPRDPEVHLNREASDELENQTRRASLLLSRLGAGIAGTEPGRPAHERDLVEGKHVVLAAESLFGRIAAGTTLHFMEQHRTGDQVFISHASKEVDFAHELAKRLRKASVTCFVAEKSIESAAEWAATIWQAIRDCRVFVALVTTASKRSTWCAAEIGSALGQKKPVVPVLLHATKLPQMLEHIQAVKAQTEEQKRELVNRLVKLCTHGKSP